MDDDPFPRMGLKPVELADRPLIQPFFASLSEPLSDYTFSQIYSWRNSLRIIWKILHGHLCVFANGTGDLTLLMPPIGDTGGDQAMAAAFELMDEYNRDHGVPGHSRVEYASEELLARFGSTGWERQPMGADYVYDVQRMIDLAGGDLASKRQAKNRFMRNYQYRVENYDPARHMESCRALLQGWRTHQDAKHLEESNTNAIKRQKESIAADLTLQTATEIGLRGIVMYARESAGAADAGTDTNSGEMPLCAFTFGEELGPDQSSITIEKTDLSLKGLAQFIFSDFCRSHWSHRPLVNVGDDWGLESLAWTKMSYRPVKMLGKFMLRKAAPVKIAVPAIPSAPVAIRPAQRDDLAASALLERDCFSAFSLKRRQLEYLRNRGSAVFLVAERGGEVIGQVIGLVRQHKRGLSGRLYTLAVRSNCRGQGIGPALLEAVTAAFAARGVKRIYLEVEEDNSAAIAIYQRGGFARIGVLPDYYGSARHAVHMMRQVNAAPMLFDLADNSPSPGTPGEEKMAARPAVAAR